MGLYYTIVMISICFTVPMASEYQYKIHLSIKPNLASCQRINETLHHCYSVISMFKLLSDNKDSTDVFIQSGVYVLNMSYTLEDLHSIQIRSNSSKPAVIMCHNNSEFDTGVAFLRVSNLTIDHLSIVECGMKHITTSYHGKGKFISVRTAIFIQNSTNVFLACLNISNSTGIGLLIYDTGGQVNITESNFTSNRLYPLDPKENGGGIHIEFTECTPGLTSCDPHDNPYNSHSRYIIDHCTFKDNVATYEYNRSESEHLINDNFITFSSGGGVSLWLNGQAKDNVFEVTSSNFTANSAKGGGGLYAISRQNATHNHVKISRCSFIENIGYKEGGGLVIGNVIYQTGGLSEFNTYNVSDCLFKRNQALTGIGGGILGFGSREPSNTKPTNHFEIHCSSFISNKAHFGSAIQINKQYFDSTTVGFMFVLVLKNCNFTSNNLHDSSYTNFSAIGTVAMSGVNVLFCGHTHFTNNTSTALMVDGATVKFSNDSMTVFQDNSGLHGGAISLIDGSNIIVYPNSTLVFLRNSAVEHGGAIYVELSTPFDFLLSHVCFVRYHLETVLPSKWETNFTFINNTARQSNSSIFTSTLQPCARAYLNGTHLFDKRPFYHYPDNNDSNISTLPVKFKFLNSSNKTCDIMSGKAFELMCSIVPGETFDLPVILEDELEEKVDTAMFIATCTGSKSPSVLLPYHLTNGTIQIAGKPNEICYLQLQTDTDYPASTVIQITLLNCPPGLVYNINKRQCQCIMSHALQLPMPAITGCEITSLQAYYNKYYWIGYKSDGATDLIVGICPYRYCYNEHVPTGQLLPRDANKSILDKFVCGNQRRTGLLCGKCIEGYSVVMNSPTFMCHKCEKVHLGILYLALSYIVPVSVLFYIIMSYNVRMTTGLISAYLFYSQIIGNHNYYSSLKGNTDISFTISNIIIAIYSISNLDFFQHDIFSYCLFSNAGTVDILAFKLLLSFYPVLLVLTYFLLRRYYICKHRCFQNCRLSSKSVTHGISAFLVLCFAKINVLAFGILKPTKLLYINGTSYSKVVYLQGDIKYFEGTLYNVYAIASLFTVVIIITIPTVILVLHPILINIVIYFEWGERRFILLINKLLLIHRLKPVLDTFQGDYKDKLRFFAGLHFISYRIIFLCVVVILPPGGVHRQYLLVSTYLSVILLIHVLVMPFKTFINNAAYSLVYLILIMIVSIEYNLFSADNSSYELIWGELLLALLPLLCIVLYCSWKLSSYAKVYWKREDRNDQLPLDDYHLLNFPQRMMNDDTTDCSDYDST